MRTILRPATRRTVLFLQCSCIRTADVPATLIEEGPWVRSIKASSALTVPSTGLTQTSIFSAASSSPFPTAPICRRRLHVADAMGRRRTWNIISRLSCPLAAGTRTQQRPLKRWFLRASQTMQSCRGNLQRNLWHIWIRTNAGLLVKTMALPFDSTKLEAYFEYAVRGLLWRHWAMYLPEDSFVMPMCITAEGEKMIEHQLSLKARARVSENLGNGTIVYRGAQGVDRPDVSVWHFKLYGGIALSGDPRAPDEETTSIVAFTAPRRVALNAKWRSGAGGLRVEALMPPVDYLRTKLSRIGSEGSRF